MKRNTEKKYFDIAKGRARIATITKRISKAQSMTVTQTCDDFNLETEAKKLHMSVEEYRKNVLYEKPKTKLNEAYMLYDKDCEDIEAIKKEFNNEVLNNEERRKDFEELDAFYNSLC